MFRCAHGCSRFLKLVNELQLFSFFFFRGLSGTGRRGFVSLVHPGRVGGWDVDRSLGLETLHLSGSRRLN